jgi:hypothetical protein
MSNLEKCISELQLVAKMKDKKAQKKVLKELAKENCFAKSVQEIAFNTVNSNIPLKPIHKKKLKKHAHIIKSLSKKSIKGKKRIKLIEQSGGALGVLLPIVASLLPAIIDAVKNV